MVWDIVGFDYDNLTLKLRNKKGDGSFKYPWSKPARENRKWSEEKAETINVPDGDLLQKLRVRAHAHAVSHLSKLARSALSGKSATTAAQMVNESLKFALKRYESKRLTAAEFVPMLRSVALVVEIPEGFWNRLKQTVNDAQLERLRQTMEAVGVLRLNASPSALAEVADYLGREAWFANNFTLIQSAAEQLQLIHKGDAFGPLSTRASRMLQHMEIEKDRESLKPWQRAAPSRQKTIRVGPSGSKASQDKPAESSAAEGSEEA